jgi:hypothetical protein
MSEEKSFPVTRQILREFHQELLKVKWTRAILVLILVRLLDRGTAYLAFLVNPSRFLKAEINQDFVLFLTKGDPTNTILQEIIFVVFPFIMFFLARRCKQANLVVIVFWSMGLFLFAYILLGSLFATVTNLIGTISWMIERMW